MVPIVVPLRLLLSFPQLFEAAPRTLFYRQGQHLAGLIVEDNRGSLLVGHDPVLGHGFGFGLGQASDGFQILIVTLQLAVFQGVDGYGIGDFVGKEQW